MKQKHFLLLKLVFIDMEKLIRHTIPMQRIFCKEIQAAKEGRKPYVSIIEKDVQRRK